MAQRTSGQLTEKQLRELRRLEFVKHALEELRKRGITQDVPICPQCKSIRIIQITSAYNLGALGSFQPAYYCLDCGWFGRTLTIMTNRPENDAIMEDMMKAFGDDSGMVDETDRDPWTNYTS